ncbi:MAG: hypothetical protein DRN03_02975 [Thermoplasmata archaeon]|nr:MAG: hypothetical protein DRN03_02975 [Thermoplasmata archaeon]
MVVRGVRRVKKRRREKKGYVVMLGNRKMFSDVFPTEKEARIALAYAIRGTDNINTAARYTKAVIKKVRK